MIDYTTISLCILAWVLVQLSGYFKITSLIAQQYNKLDFNQTMLCILFIHTTMFTYNLRARVDYINIWYEILTSKNPKKILFATIFPFVTNSGVKSTNVVPMDYIMDLIYFFLRVMIFIPHLLFTLGVMIYCLLTKKSITPPKIVSEVGVEDLY